MSDKLNITEFEQLLRDQLGSAEVPAPSDLWEGMADSLAQLNSDLQFDHQLQDQLQEAQVEAPTEVWQAVQQSVVVQSGGLLGSFAAKLILGIGASALLTAGILFFSDSDKDKVAEPVSEELTVAAPDSKQDQVDSIPEERNDELATSNQSTTASPSQTITNSGTHSIAQTDAPSSEGGQQNPSAASTANNGSPAQQNKPNATGSGSGNQEQNNQGGQESKALYMLMSFLSEDTSVCDGTRFELNVYRGNFSQLQVWVDNQKLQTLMNPGVIQFDKLSPGLHQVRFKALKGEEMVERNLNVRVNERPKAELYVEDYGKGKFIFSMNMNSAMQYGWYLDGQYRGVGNFWDHQFRDFQEQKHRIVLSMKSVQGCLDSVVKNFTNTSTVEVREPNLRGNAFTPNGDGFADELLIDVSGETYWKLSIYSSQKTKVFESTDAREGWNGKNQFTGAICEAGQYYCVLTYTLHGQETKTEQWYISLIR